MPNPYNLISTLPPEQAWYKVLDLKDAFFCLRLHPNSQPVFAFEWHNPENGRTRQLTWTRLPQGFKNSPTLFDEALHRDLAPFRAGFCRLWIPRFATLAAPLYPLTKEKGEFIWTKEHQLAFETLKKALLQAPVLALPDLKKPFTLYIDERNGVVRGVLTQTLGPWRHPVAYLSKKLDPVASRWPSCLRAIAATAVLVKDADKLTMGQNVTIVAPHALESVVRQPPDRWMTNARMTHYQSLLLTERVTFAPSAILNPATLLPEADEARVHRCEEITGRRNWNSTRLD